MSFYRRLRPPVTASLNEGRSCNLLSPPSEKRYPSNLRPLLERRLLLGRICSEETTTFDTLYPDIEAGNSDF